jgi:hypothetical protein
MSGGGMASAAVSLPPVVGELDADAWEKLTTEEGACYYQQHVIGSMAWQDSVDLSQFRVWGAKFGGPIALMRDKTKPLKIGQAAVANNKIFIFTAGGRLLSEITWDVGEDRGEIAEMGWNDEELLVIMQDNGAAEVYDMHGIYRYNFFTSRAVQQQGVSACQIWGSGAVVLTMENQLFWVNAEDGFESPRTIAMQDPRDYGLDATPTCMAVVEPALTGRDSPDVLLSSDDGTVIVVDTEQVEPFPTTQGPFKKMECSANGQLFACFTTEGQVVVFPSDFSDVILDFSTRSTTAPEQLVWCGGDSVVLAYEKIVFMVGPSGSWINFRPDAAFKVVPEMDGVRIITNTESKFLQRVPEDLVNVLQAGSVDPAAMMYDAYQELYDRKSAKADEKMRAIEDDLEQAVNTCIGAATDPWDTVAQKKLLDAACYGKAFVENYDSSYFVNTCKDLRVLNMLRSPAIGIHLTYKQYEHLTPDTIVSRLIRRAHWKEAYMICHYLELEKSERVSVQWACDKIKLEEDTPDQELCRKIYAKLKDCPGGSFVDVAVAAEQENRKKLAVMLLDYEASAIDQVPLLLQMDEPEQALMKALDSGDTNLAHSVLMALKERGRDQDADDYLPRNEFYAMLTRLPAAASLFVSHLREKSFVEQASGGGSSLEDLKSFFYSAGQSADAAAIDLVAAYREPELPNRLRNLELAMDSLQQDKASYYSAKMTEDQIKLLAIQRELEMNCDGQIKYVDTSLADTIHTLIETDQEKKAKKLSGEFKLSEKRYAWIKMRALIKAKKIPALEKFSKEKKLPIQMESFVKCLVEDGHPDDASRFVSKLVDSRGNPLGDKQVTWFMRLEKYPEAVKVAMAMKDLGMVEQIQSQISPALLKTKEFQAIFAEAKRELA